MSEYICSLCPRNCRAVRSSDTGEGVCSSGTLPRIARAALHFGEEPCISGTRGSGTVFFTGCNLHCVYCQNEEISRIGSGTGKVVSIERLREIFKELTISLRSLKPLKRIRGYPWYTIQADMKSLNLSGC